MNGKKKILVILAVVGLACFGLSFGLTKRVKQKEHAAQEEAKATTQASGEPVVEPGLAVADLASLRPGERQLEELRKEYRQKLETCRKKEDELNALAKRVQIEQDMLKKQAQDLENLQMQLVAPLARLKEAQAELQRTRISVALTERTNLKRTAQIYSSMDSASGGKILTGMCENKQEDDAVKILFYMQERPAAKLLAEIPDRTTAARLIEKLKMIKEES
jgi:hypothetical protein